MDDLTYQVAARLMGEASVLGLPGMVAVAATMAWRLASPNFPDTLPEVLDAYYGWQEPNDAAYTVAGLLVRNPSSIGDLAYAIGLPEVAQEPFYYAMGGEDVRRNGWDTGLVVLVSESTGYSLHLYQDPPWEKTPRPATSSPRNPPEDWR